MKFGDNLRKIRKSKKMSQEQLAEKMNVTRQSVSKWENGESYPEMNNIFELCKVFNCKLNELVYPDMSDISSLDEEIVMNVVKFNEKKQKEVKTLSNIIAMIGKIGSIVLKVAIPFIIIAMLIVPYIVSNLEVKENEITFKSESIKIVDENKIEVHGVIIGEYDGDLADNEVIKLFINNSKVKIISYFESAMIFLIINIFLMKLKILFFFLFISFSTFAQANQSSTTDESLEIPDLIGFFNTYTTLSEREDEISTLNSQFSILICFAF